ncbi:HEPN domain-containing protein [bacterium]|nr:HEPN domain-containing protein [bacterium]
MKISKMINYWVEGAEDDLKTAKSLFVSKRYHHCLFFCHLFLEKIIKALVVKKIKHQAPYVHNLVRLSELSGIEFSEEQLDLLAEITSFNIEARYNDYKRKFFKKATKEYTEGYFEKAKDIYLWLKSKL